MTITFSTQYCLAILIPELVTPTPNPTSLPHLMLLSVDDVTHRSAVLKWTPFKSSQNFKYMQTIQSVLLNTNIYFVFQISSTLINGR